MGEPPTASCLIAGRLPVRFSEDHYAAHVVVTAYLGDHKIAQYVMLGQVCSIRWLHINYPTPGYIENFDSEAAGRAAIEAWAAGLDPVPWDADGRPDC